MAIYIDLLETASTLFVWCCERHGLRCTSQNLLFLSHVESNLNTYIQDLIATAKAAHEARDTSPSYLENAVDITISNPRVPQGFQMLACFALYYPTTVESSKRNNPVERRKASAKKLYFLPRYGLSTFHARTTTVRVPTSRPQWAIISYTSNHQLLIRLHALRLSETSITFSSKYLSLSYSLLTLH